jgi:hypothetical protein
MFATRTARSTRSTRTRRCATVVAASLIMVLGISESPASARAAKWVLVGKDSFTIDGQTTVVPVYVNSTSIVGDRNSDFTITFQGRFKGRRGINRINISVYTDCVAGDASADQFDVYYTAGTDDYEIYTAGDLSPIVSNKALSYCY